MVHEQRFFNGGLIEGRIGGLSYDPKEFGNPGERRWPYRFVHSGKNLFPGQSPLDGCVEDGVKVTYHDLCLFICSGPDNRIRHTPFANRAIRTTTEIDT
ncbi:hypothetical protein B2D07_04045 [Desulfococcus multivorans]|nr:hypothetical protein B2D07_04045 [Desulfococcus multivorans]